MILVVVGRPQREDDLIVGLAQPYRSALWELSNGQPQALRNVAIEMLVRALSMRDVEDTCRDESGRLFR